MGPPVYVDLAYIPNHCSGKNTDLEFFKRVRASYYVVSGNDAANGEPSRAVLDALLEGKSQWGENLQVGHGNARECVCEMFLVSQVLGRRFVSQTFPEREHSERKQMVLGMTCSAGLEELLFVPRNSVEAVLDPSEGRKHLEITHTSSSAAGQVYPQEKTDTQVPELQVGSAGTSGLLSGHQQ